MQSGIGREGLLPYLEARTVILDGAPPATDETETVGPCTPIVPPPCSASTACNCRTRSPSAGSAGAGESTAAQTDVTSSRPDSRYTTGSQNPIPPRGT
jgi:hypothetical protein